MQKIYKILSILILLLCLSGVNMNYYSISAQNNEINSLAALPQGYYFLCCHDGDLILYNILGQAVGWGPDCGGLDEGECIKVVVCSQPICDNSSNPADANDILDLINSLEESESQEAIEINCPGCVEYTFYQSEISW